MGKTQILLTLTALVVMVAVCQSQDVRQFGVDDLLFRPDQRVSRRYDQDRLIELLGAEAETYDLQSCGCKATTCGCCLHIKFDTLFHFDQKACVMVSYLPKEKGVELKLTLNDKTIMRKEISIENPPPACVGIPFLTKLASICVKFHDLQVKSAHLSGCIEIDINLAMATVAKYNLGCFRIPPSEKLGTARFLSSTERLGADAMMLSFHSLTRSRRLGADKMFPEMGALED